MSITPHYTFSMFRLHSIWDVVVKIPGPNTKSLEDSCINSQVQHQVQPDDILNDIPLWASLRFIWGSTCPEVSSFRADSLEDVLIVYIGHQ